MRRWGIIASLGVVAIILVVNDAVADSRRHRRGGWHRHDGSHRHRRAHRRRLRSRLFLHHAFWYGPRWYGPRFAYPVWYGPRFIPRGYHKHHHHHYAHRGHHHVDECGFVSSENEALGGVLGAIGGAVVGHQIGDGSGRVLATFAGTIIGGMLGAGVGRDLDDAQRLKLEVATQYALENQRSGTRTTWRGPGRRACGVIVPRPAFRNEVRQYCREFQQTIVIDGKRESAYGTACRQPDGQWKIAN